MSTLMMYYPSVYSSAPQNSTNIANTSLDGWMGGGQVSFPVYSPEVLA